MGSLVDAFDRAAAEAPAPASERTGSLVDQFDAAAKEADALRAQAEEAARKAKPEPVKLASPPGKLASFGAAAGEAVGRGALAVQQIVGKGLQTAGDLANPPTGNLRGEPAAPNMLQQSGGWLLQDAVQGVRKLAAENAPYAAENPKTSMAGTITGAVLSPVNKLIPAASAPSTLVGAATQGALQGAALNALTNPVQDDKHFLREKAEQAGVGLIGGAVGGSLAYGLGKGLDKAVDLVRRVANRATAGNVGQAADGAVDAALQAVKLDPAAVKAERPELFAGLKDQVAEAVKSGRNVDPAALKRLVQAQTLPVPVPMLKGQITRDPMQFAKEMNLRGIKGVGEPITETYTAQNQALLANLDALGAKRGTDVVSAGKAAIDTLAAADKARNAQVGAAYEAFKKATGRELDVPLKGLAQDYAVALREFGDAIPGAIRRKFEDLGLMSGTAQRVFSIGDAEALIKSINRNYDPSNRVQARALDELRRGVQKAISEGAGEGAEAGAAAALAKSARAAAASRFGLLEATPGLKAAVQGHEPDKFVQKFILQGNVGEIRSMVKTLESQDPKALAGLQDSLVQLIKERVGNLRGEGNATFSSDALKKFVNDPNMSRRIGAVLGPEKMNALRQLYEVSENALYAPTAAAVNRSNTASAAANLVKEEVQGGSMNTIADLLSKYAPVLSGPAQAAKAANQASRASRLVDEAVNPRLGAQTGGSNVVDILSRNLRPDVAAARTGAAALQERNRREAQR